MMSHAFLSRSNRSFIALLLLLFLSAGFLVLNDYLGSTMTMALWGVLFLILFSRGIHMQKNVVLATLLTIILIFTTNLVNGEDIRRIFAWVIIFICASMFVFRFSFDEFTESFINVLFLLSVISCVFFFLFRFIPSLTPFFTTHVANRGAFVNLIVYQDMLINRNSGMFWEPGAFQAFANIALLFEVERSIVRPNRLFVFILTILTTGSSTGMFALGFLLLFILLKSSVDDYSRKKIKRVLFLLIPLIIIYIYIYREDFFGTAGYTTFGKLEGIDDWDSLNGKYETSSMSIRWNSIVKPLEAFLEKPLLGWGSLNLSDRNYSFTQGMNTCTFVNWYAVNGMFFGLLMTVGLFKFCNLLAGKKNSLRSLFYFFFFFLITSTESFTYSPILFIMAMFGYGGIRSRYSSVLTAGSKNGSMYGRSNG